MKYGIKLIIRIIIAIIIALSSKLYYFILAPITLYATYAITKLFTPITLQSNKFFIDGLTLEFVPACVAVAAYILLSLLILLTKDIGCKKLIKLFLLGFFLIFIANIIRIELMIYVLTNFGSNLFKTLDLFFWKVLSTIYIVFVWIFLTRLFKINTIPIYSDIKYLLKKLR